MKNWCDKTSLYVQMQSEYIKEYRDTLYTENVRNITESIHKNGKLIVFDDLTKQADYSEFNRYLKSIW